ncbi:T9SS type A sorting domain-containing protein [Rosettibacter firmus]|uniref:T9SS type A sorting domain-containing protein n=1 Tax=Rosettibacter firmus TaxID=3111522 RepID=UPI00336C0C70
MKKLLFIILLPIISFAQDNLATERWSPPIEIKSIISYFPKGVNTPYINPAGNILYFESEGRIYFIEKSDSSWSSPHNIQIDGSNQFSYPKIAPSNNRLFFVIEKNSRKNLFYIEREDEHHNWSDIRSCGDYINNDSIYIEDYVLQNDTTIFLSIGFSMYYSKYERAINNWGPLIKSPDFYYDFFPGNFGGTFINLDYTKVYHTSLFMVATIIDGQMYDFLKFNLVVRYKDFQNHFGQSFLLNINADIDSVYGKKIPNYNYFALSPSLTKNGKTLFFAVKYADTTRIYYSNMIVDENGEIVNVVENINNTIPSTYYLSQNYPNPFNSITKIRYAVPKSSHISIRVFDILGNEITTLVDQFKNIGNYEIEFNANHLSSGVYFYQLVAENNVLTKKLILIK